MCLVVSKGKRDMFKGSTHMHSLVGQQARGQKVSDILGVAHVHHTVHTTHTHTPYTATANYCYSKLQVFSSLFSFLFVQSPSITACESVPAAEYAYLHGLLGQQAQQEVGLTLVRAQSNARDPVHVQKVKRHAS